MYGDEFSCIFSTFEWNELLRMFANEVKAKRYDKLEYDRWRELKEISESMETWDLVRVYWNDDYDHWIPINVYIDTRANGKPDMPFEFDSGDSSFGSFLYELELYREEKEQMRVKENYYTDAEGREWQTYDRYPATNHSIDEDVLELLKSSDSLGVSVLNDTADVVCDTLATKADVTSLNRIEEKVNALAAEVAAASPMKNDDSYKNQTNKESNIMKFNFDFGPVNPNSARMSMYGLAVKNKVGTWVSYDAKNGAVMDVDVLSCDGAKFLYKMPVAMKDIAVGDVIIHHNVPMFVVGVVADSDFVTAIDPIAGERKDVMLTKSPFGFNFVTKVVNLLGNLNANASKDNPFGNLGLMLMMNDSNDMGDLFPLMLMTGKSGLDMSNPLMLYALMGKESKSGNDNMLPLMLMMMNTQNAMFTAPAKICTCGGQCGENHTQN